MTRLVTRLRRAGLAAVGLATIAGCLVACIDGELGTVGASATLDTDVHLTSEQPVAVRHLTFSATAVGNGVSADIVILGTLIRDDGVHAAPPVTISARPDDPARILWRGGTPDERLPGAQLTFSGICADGCGSGVTVVVRRAGDEPGPVDVRIVSRLRVSAPFQKDRSFGVTPEVVEDPTDRFDGAPATVAATASRAVRLGAGPDIVRMALSLHADAAVIGAVRRYPVVGSLVVRGVGDAPTRAALSSSGAWRIGSLIYDQTSQSGISLAAEGNPTDLDWLSRCPATGACDLAFELVLSGSSLQSMAGSNAGIDPSARPSPPTSFQLELQATAILEAFDGRELDPAGLTVTMETKR